MNLTLLGTNILAFKKDGKNYAMTCAWSTQCEADELVLFIGSQSISAKQLEVGMKVGYSCLNTKQEKLALEIGSTHSDEIDKFKDRDIIEKNGAVVFKDSYAQAFCEVKKLATDICDCLLVVLKVIEKNEANQGLPLSYNELSKAQEV